jgi:hypothetical protein
MWMAAGWSIPAVVRACYSEREAREQDTEMRRPSVSTGMRVVALAGLLGLAGSPAHAQRIENQVAVFSALDKVTARISRLEIPLGEAKQFGALKVVARTCLSRPPTEPPKTSTFVEIEETQLDGKQKRIFSGWMFAESPGLHALEHPVFDVWLTECAQPRSAPQPATAAARPGTVPGKQGQPAAAQGQPAPGTDEAQPARRRPPR